MTACITVLLKLTVIYSISSLRAFSNRVLVFILSYSHASQLIPNFVLGFLSYSAPGPGNKYERTLGTSSLIFKWMIVYQDSLCRINSFKQIGNGLFAQ